MEKDTLKGILLMENGEVIKFELYPQYAPNTVANFVKLANSGFYDGLTFHRVIKGFVSQGGDPRGDGTGELAYTIKNENEGNPLRHEAGSIAMAHRGRDTASCQFYICHEPQPHLDRDFTVFGKVTENLEAVRNMHVGDVIKKIEVLISD